MDIPESLINYYLSQVTVGYFNRNELPPEDLSGYDPQITRVEMLALSDDEMEPLKLGLEYLLGNPQIDCQAFNGGRYPFNDKRVREIIEYVWRSLWPDAEPIPPGGPPGVRLVKMPLADWRARRKAGASG